MRIRILSSILLLWIPCAYAANSGDWDFFRTVSTFYGTWSTEQGRATVEIVDGKVKIQVYEKEELIGSENGTAKEGLAETLEGTVTADGKVQVTETFPGTDANPVTIEGRLYRRYSKEHWGDKDVNVLYETIMFSSNYMAMGLTHRAVQKDASETKQQ